MQAIWFSYPVFLLSPSSTADLPFDFRRTKVIEPLTRLISRVQSARLASTDMVEAECLSELSGGRAGHSIEPVGISNALMPQVLKR